MLRVREIESVGQSLRRFRIEDDGHAASPASLKLVSLYAGRLLAENEVPGECRADGEGALVMEFPPSDTTFFYDGIVFAALDAFNHPNKNPTITDLAPVRDPPKK
ncbi:MAG TPA: hypothetical protein VF376_14255 [Thermoanaerobaculia bacterium]